MQQSNVISVSALNDKIKSLLEATFLHVAVEGEVASFTYHTSGHLYFSIKDDKSTLKCVMWRSSVAKMKFRLEQGMHLIVYGSVSVYAPRGEYQLQAVSFEPFGQGALALAFEQLKKKLQQKGYFDPLRKKPLPKFPKKIALVTAKESAALHDMLKITSKRWPHLHIIVVDTLVQGEQAAPMIAGALEFADRLGADVVIVGRGGGSKEDLWAFNEEPVADAIFAMKTPVVSAVGHEVDMLISDMVADLRAPTPSAAMEMVLPDQDELLRYLDEMLQQYYFRWEQLLRRHENMIMHLYERLAHLSPSKRVQLYAQRIEDSYAALKRTIDQKIDSKDHLIGLMPQNIRAVMDTLLNKNAIKIDYLRERVKLLDPAKGLKKGWAQVVKDQKPISICQLKKNDKVALFDGKCKVEASIVKIL